MAKAVQEVSERASLLVREEIALAKAEVTEKMTGLAKGAAVGAAAGVFILAGLIYFLHFIALLLADLLGDTWWLGYLIVAGVLFLLGGLAGFLASRFLKKGSPPAAATGEPSPLERPEVQAGIAFAGAFVIARIFNRLVG